MMLNKEVLQAMAEGRTTRNVSDDDIESKFECPVCFSSWFGSSRWMENGREHKDYQCHDEYGRGCSWIGSESECFVYAYEPQTLAIELLAAYKKIEKLEGK